MAWWNGLEENSPATRLAGFDCAKGGKTRILMQEFNMVKSYFPKQIQLISDRLRWIFLIDVFKYFRSVINSIANGASTVADCPVSRFEKRATSLSNRFFISSSDDFCSSGVTIISIYPANILNQRQYNAAENSDTPLFCPSASDCLYFLLPVNSNNVMYPQ